MFGRMAVRRLLAVASLALTTLATAETGVTDGSILIGQSVPLTGPATAVLLVTEVPVAGRR